MILSHSILWIVFLELSSYVFFKSLYFLITFFVLYKSQFSGLSSDIPHSHFSKSVDFEFFHALNYAMWIRAMSKGAKLIETVKTDKARSLSHSALGYQSSLERFLAQKRFQLNSFQFRSWIKDSFRIELELHTELEHIFKLRKNFRQFLSLFLHDVRQARQWWLFSGNLPAKLLDFSLTAEIVKST